MHSNQKWAVVTGSTGGIGSAVSNLLAEMNWNLILINRSMRKAEAQSNTLSAQYPNIKTELYTVDMIDVVSVKETAAAICSDHPAIGLVYNIAGILTDKKQLSAQGFESHFAVNCIAPYVLTQALLAPLSQASIESRRSAVINFSSSAVFSAKTFSVEALKRSNYVEGLFGSYANSKLAADVFSDAIAPDLLSKNIFIYSVDPGATKTAMTAGNAAMPFIVRLLRPLLFKSPERQAEKLVKAVEQSILENRTGLYIAENKVKPAPKIASDAKIQGELLALLKEISAQN